MYVPDNYDAYDAYEAKQEAKRARLSVCECCGNTIYDDYLYDFDGVLMHEECMKDNYRKNADDYEREI